jgi:hypothetical protein
MRNILTQTIPACAAACVLTFVTGCQTNDHGSAQSSTKTASTVASPPATSVAPAPATTSAAPAPAVAKSVIRIKTGVSAGFTDSSGNAWQADQGFADGETIERPDLQIANTKDPAIYRAERYSMTRFTQALPNGKYLVKLHFCETYDGITGPGARVFSFNVEGHEFKNFDVWAKSGGFARAYIETVPVEITDGKLDITFTPNVENPEINGIEVIPQR